MLDEQWRIIEAYANLLDINTGQVFRVSRFLNEVPIFSKDKRGNNIAIIVIMAWHGIPKCVFNGMQRPVAEVSAWGDTKDTVWGRG